jgi:hypothetical protein
MSVVNQTEDIQMIFGSKHVYLLVINLLSASHSRLIFVFCSIYTMLQVLKLVHFVLRCLAHNPILFSTNAFGRYRVSFSVNAGFLHAPESAKTANNAVFTVYNEYCYRASCMTHGSAETLCRNAVVLMSNSVPQVTSDSA